MLYLRQSTASQSVLIGPFVDSTDGVTAETGLTIANTDIRLSANGGNMVAKNSGGGTHDEIGYYSITLDATDTATVGRLQVAVAASGALPVYHEFQVLEEAIYDGMFAASAARIPADVTAISGDTTAADNAESFFDGTGYAGTNNVIPSVTTVTGNVDGSVGSVTGAINTAAGTITTLDALDTAQDTQHGTTQTAISNLNDPTAAAIADAVWDEDATGHQTGGTFGQAIGDPGANTETIYDAVVTDAAGTNVAADIIAVKAETASILTDTAEIGAAGAGLTAINLPDQTMNITGNITGNLSGSVGSVTGNVGGTVAELGTQAKADVNAEVLDVLNTDTFAEPGQGTPGATITLAAKIGYLYKAFRNRTTQTADTYTLYNDDATTAGQTAAVSDDATTFERGEVTTGA